MDNKLISQIFIIVVGAVIVASGLPNNIVLSIWPRKIDVSITKKPLQSKNIKSTDKTKTQQIQVNDKSVKSLSIYAVNLNNQTGYEYKNLQICYFPKTGGEIINIERHQYDGENQLKVKELAPTNDDSICYEYDYIKGNSTLKQYFVIQNENESAISKILMELKPDGNNNVKLIDHKDKNIIDDGL